MVPGGGARLGSPSSGSLLLTLFLPHHFSVFQLSFLFLAISNLFISSKSVLVLSVFLALQSPSLLLFYYVIINLFDSIHGLIL